MDIQATLKKWSDNAQRSGEAYKRGIQAVTESPTAKAADRAESYVRGVTAAVADGRYQRGLRAVTLTEWKDAASGIGARRHAEGVKAAEPKMAEFLQQFLPFAENLSKEIDRMPKGTDGDADARMLAAVARLRQFRFQKRGG